MADTATTGLPAATLIDGDDSLYVVEDGNSRKVAVSELLVFILASINAYDIGYNSNESVGEALDAVVGGGVSDGDKGDLTVSSGGTVWTIDDEAVTNAKLAHIATLTIKGRVSGSTGDVEDLTAAQAASIVQGTGLDVDAAGFRGVPQNAQTGNYTTVAADAGKHIFHASGAGAGDTYTIDSNANVAYEIGTAITFVNLDSNDVSIAITSDTLILADAGTTGTRTLGENGVATALKVGTTTWLISGSGLT